MRKAREEKAKKEKAAKQAEAARVKKEAAEKAKRDKAAREAKERAAQKAAELRAQSRVAPAPPAAPKPNTNPVREHFRPAASCVLFFFWLLVLRRLTDGVWNKCVWAVDSLCVRLAARRAHLSLCSL